MTSELREKVFFLVSNRFKAASRHTETLKTLISQHVPLVNCLNMTIVQQAMKVLKKRFSKTDWTEVKYMFKSVFVFMVNEHRPELNLKNIEELLQKYPEFEAEDAEEKFLLFQFLNYLTSALLVVDPKNKKGELIGLVGRICGAIYVTGGGQTDATNRRVMIFERETGIEPRKLTLERKRKTEESRAYTVELARRAELTSQLEAKKKMRLETQASAAGDSQKGLIPANLKPAAAKAFSSQPNVGYLSQKKVNQRGYCGLSVPNSNEGPKFDTTTNPSAMIPLPLHLRLQSPHSTSTLSAAHTSGWYGYNSTYGSTPGSHYLSPAGVHGAVQAHVPYAHNPYAGCTPYDLGAYQYAYQDPLPNPYGQGGRDMPNVHDVHGFSRGVSGVGVCVGAGVVDRPQEVKSTALYPAAATATVSPAPTTTAGTSTTSTTNTTSVRLTDSPSTVDSASPRSALENEEEDEEVRYGSVDNTEWKEVSPLPSVMYGATYTNINNNTTIPINTTNNTKTVNTTSAISTTTSITHISPTNSYPDGIQPSYDAHPSYQDYGYDAHYIHNTQNTNYHPQNYQPYSQYYVPQTQYYPPSYPAHYSDYPTHPSVHPSVHSSYLHSAHYLASPLGSVSAEYQYERGRHDFANLQQYYTQVSGYDGGSGGSGGSGRSNGAFVADDNVYASNEICRSGGGSSGGSSSGGGSSGGDSTAQAMKSAPVAILF